jgi:branched-chain amino acid transport system ATP-binding protein
VEQSIKFAQTVADRHYIVEHGRVVDMVPSAQLASSMDRLRVYLGV